MIAAMKHEATENEEHWYRAEIVKIVSKDVVEVFYLDYGNFATHVNTSLYKLRPDMYNLRPLAVECFLANVKDK